MNKIRVIDLLSKLANGEEVPKKIRVGCCEFEYDEELNTYFNINKASPVKGLVQDWLCNTIRLNNEVKIIEDKEDINIQDIKELDVELFNNQSDLEHKINDLIKAVKQLDKTKEDK